MSWFAEITGKAEDLLNRVDQTAATALQTKSKSPSRMRPPNTQGDNEVTLELSVHSASPSPKRISALAPHGPTASRKSLYGPGALTQKKKPESDDEKLLRYLNNSENLPSTSKKTQVKLDSPVKKQLPDLEGLSQDTVAIEQVVKDVPSSENGPIPDSCDSNALKNNDDKEKKISRQTVAEECNSVPLNNSKLETSEDSKLVTFKEDVSLAQNSVVLSVAERMRMQKKLEHSNSQISGNVKVVRELREREKDMIAAMDAKDSQLAILKVRLQEADHELQLKRSIVKDLETENDRLIKEHAQSAALQNKTVEVVQEQLQQTESELNKTKESFHHNQNEQMHKMGKMEEEHRHLIESYSTLQKKWTELNDRSKELSIQLKQAHGNFETLQQEYNDYKQKAQRILQSKEKLISSLKDGHMEADNIEKSEATSMLLSAEVEGMKQERDLIRDELRRANELVETYRTEIQELEKMSQNETVTSQERCKVLKDQLDLEKSQKEEFQLLNTQLKEEFQLLHEDMTRTKSNFQSRIQDREIEIEKLRRQLTAKSLSTVSQEELESRLHALTENLIQKQTLVEALSTEKNSLVLQLERMEQQLREAQNYGLQQHTYVGINNNEAERKSKAVFLENPFDSALTRNVKKVYGSINSFSIRLGVFFRRYPITRVFIIIYMLLLHFWVMIVLLTYEPEIHNASYDISKNQ